MEKPVELNPAQQQVLEVLGADRDERPSFDAVLRHELRGYLEQELLEQLDRVTDDQMFVAKHLLGQVFGCEQRFVTEEAIPFEWRVPIARGSVAHKAIELSIHRKGQPLPLELVDDAIASLTAATDGLAEYLQTCGEVAIAEIRAEANDRLTKFMECFPPLNPRWWPVTESKLRLEIHDRFIFSGKVDLSLGKADGRTAGKVLIDLKTGGFSMLHREDLRFYALIETVRLGVPPRLLATYYVDKGTIHPEQVTEDLLFAAAKRVVDGVGKILDLRESERQPTTAPSGACRWCAALLDCQPGSAHLESSSDEG